jgi:hypothetical protein
MGEGAAGGVATQKICGMTVKPCGEREITTLGVGVLCGKKVGEWPLSVWPYSAQCHSLGATPSTYGERMASVSKRPSRAVKPAGYRSQVKNERHRGARPTVGGEVAAPYRLTIRLSVEQWQTLNEAAQVLGLGRRGLSQAARRLLLHGLGVKPLHPHEAKALNGVVSPLKRGRPMVAGSASQ